MLQFNSKCHQQHAAQLPVNTRPLVRYRREDFGWLAVFPDGRTALYDAAAEPLLAAGCTFEECSPHRLAQINLPTRFRFEAPLISWLELTRACNLKCPHCFARGGSPRENELSTADLKNLLKDWAAMGMFSVVITGGEPTGHQDFLEIVNYAHQLALVISIATNGTLLTDKMLAAIPREDVMINLSLDDIHLAADQKNPKNEFDFVTQRILEIQKQGFNVNIMTTTTSANIQELQKVIDWAVEHDVSLRSVPFLPMGRGGRHHELANTPRDVSQAAHFWIAEEKWERVKDPKIGITVGKLYNFLLTMEFAARRCMCGRGICYVDSGGDVYPCSLCLAAEILCAGNVRHRDFPTIWRQGEWQIRDYVWQRWDEICNGCKLSGDDYFCNGRCVAGSMILNGKLLGCGSTAFNRASIMAREKIFREQVKPEPRVPVRPVT